MNSAEIRCHPETNRPVCDYGEISRTWVSSDAPGIMKDMGPLILISRDFDAETANLAHFAVRFGVFGDCARTEARNGTWVHRLQPAHWKDGIKPSDQWCDEIMLGRWPD